MNAVERISRGVFAATGRDFESYKNTSRKRGEVNIRAIMAYIMRHDYNMTYGAIGEVLNQDHSTAMFAINKVEDWVKMPQQYASEIELIKAIRSPEPNALDYLATTMQFWNDTLTQGEGFMCLPFNCAGVETGFLIPASASEVVSIDDFSKSSESVANFLGKHKFVLMKDGYYFRARIIEDNVELSVMEHYEAWEDVVDAALESRTRIIYNANTKSEETI